MNFRREALFAGAILAGTIASGCSDAKPDYKVQVDCTKNPDDHVATGTVELAGDFGFRNGGITIEFSDHHSSTRIRLNTLGHAAIGSSYATTGDAGKVIANLQTAAIVAGAPADHQTTPGEPQYKAGDSAITLVCQSSDLAPPHA